MARPNGTKPAIDTAVVRIVNNFIVFFDVVSRTSGGSVGPYIALRKIISATIGSI
jgi:hypothetical protein